MHPSDSGGLLRQSRTPCPNSRSNNPHFPTLFPTPLENTFNKVRVKALLDFVIALSVAVRNTPMPCLHLWRSPVDFRHAVRAPAGSCGLIGPVRIGTEGTFADRSPAHVVGLSDLPPRPSDGARYGARHCPLARLSWQD